MPATMLLAIGAGAVWIAAVGAVGLRGRARRDRDALGPAPQAVLILLEAPARHGDPRVLDAAVLELAARGVVELIPAGSRGPAMIRPAALAHERLSPEYLDVLLARLLHRWGLSGTPIPVSALSAAEDRKALLWRREFDKAVRREATARGLMQPPLPLFAPWSLLFSGLVPSALIFFTLAHYWKEQTFLPFLAFALAETLTVGATLTATRVRVTRTGRVELAEALRAQADAVAATAQARQNPERRRPPGQLNPLPAHQIWSDHGGSWHPLNLQSREVYRDSGSRPELAGVSGVAFFCAGSAAVHARNSHHLSVMTAVAFLGLPAAFLAALAIRVALRRKLPKRLVLQGKVARLWPAQQADARAGRGPSQYHCVLDVGRAPQSVRLILGPRTYQNLEVGDVLEVAVRPRRGRIAGLRNLGADFV